MDYQLVIKFRRSALGDDRALATIQDELLQALGGAGTWDGYDTSAREINLFVITPEPKPAFRRLKTVLEGHGMLQGTSAAYRLMGGAQFTSLWPLRNTRTFKLP